jgi:hypothetical protein
MNEADGKASTTATFSEPGEYILRAQANDTTGEGGRGFQCCWTNVHVKVTVTPAVAALRALAPQIAHEPLPVQKLP